jgi:hypothetical protein
MISARRSITRVLICLFEGNLTPVEPLFRFDIAINSTRASSVPAGPQG